jgi:hypothetical protein
MGAVLAKRLYPELDDAGVTIFARDFMDRAMGNFHASQRPVFFQGTLGVALGLFQTYMLTFAQQAYRALELKNYKALERQCFFRAVSLGRKVFRALRQCLMLLEIISLMTMWISLLELTEDYQVRLPTSSCMVFLASFLSWGLFLAVETWILEHLFSMNLWPIASLSRAMRWLGL